MSDNLKNIAEVTLNIKVDANNKTSTVTYTTHIDGIEVSSFDKKFTEKSESMEIEDILQDAVKPLMHDGRFGS